MKLGSRRAWARPKDESGFTLIEAVVAIGLAAFILLTIAYTSAASLNSVRTSKLFQSATGIGQLAIERARDTNYSVLGHVTSDLSSASDPRILSTCSGHTGSNFFDPDGSGPLACEKLVEAATTAGASIATHITTEQVGAEEFELARYVTFVNDANQALPGQSYKRVLSIVTWEDRGVTRTYRATSIVARARRGLPSPKFTLTPASQAASYQAGATVAFPMSVKNDGVTDVYDLSMALPAGRSWTCPATGTSGPCFYADTDNSATFDPTSDSLLANTNAGTVPDTGELATNQTLRVFVVWALASNEAAGSVALTVRFTSGLDPTVFKETTLNLTIAPSGLQYFLHNSDNPPSADTQSALNRPMNPTVPTATGLFRYSTNSTNFAGRFVDKESASSVRTSTDRVKVATWVVSVPAGQSLSSATLQIWVGAKDMAASKRLRMVGWLIDKATTTATTGTEIVAFSDSAFMSQASTFTQRTINLTFPSWTIAAGRVLELRIGFDANSVPSNANNSSEDGAMLAYDTTAYPSVLTVAP